MAALEPPLGTVLALPHRVGDLECLLEQLEAFAEGREREPERLGLLLVPGGPDAEGGAAAGEHVERGVDLGQQARAHGQLDRMALSVVKADGFYAAIVLQGPGQAGGGVLPTAKQYECRISC